MMGGSPAGNLPSEEEQAMGLCWAGFQAAALVRDGCVCGAEGALCDNHNLPR